MLKIDLQLDEMAAFRRMDGSLSRTGAGLNVIPSKAVISKYVLSADATCVWVGQSGTEDARFDNVRNVVDYEGFLITVQGGPNSAVLVIERTQVGNTPLYVVCSDRNFVASWDFSDSVRLLNGPKPDVEACKIYLDYGQCRTRDMVISGVQMLWPGERLEFSNKGIRIDECSDLSFAIPANLTSDADATGAVIDYIARLIDDFIPVSCKILLELSGGYDSSCSAIGAARLGRILNSYAVIHDGAVGRQQFSRRNEIISKLNLNDFTGSASDVGPFEALARDDHRITPYDDMYRYPCVEAVRNNPNGRFDVLVTGIGGDELTMRNTFLKYPWEVPGPISSSASVASLGRADMFLREGIYAVHPLSNPGLVDFCRRLPSKMLRDRLLNVLILARAGLSDGFIFPRLNENYAYIPQREAALIDFDNAFSDSPTMDFKIANIQDMLDEAAKSTNGGFSLELVTKLYTALKLDKILARYC